MLVIVIPEMTIGSPETLSLTAIFGAVEITAIMVSQCLQMALRLVCITDQVAKDFVESFKLMMVCGIMLQ